MHRTKLVVLGVIFKSTGCDFKNRGYDFNGTGCDFSGTGRHFVTVPCMTILRIHGISEYDLSIVQGVTLIVPGMTCQTTNFPRVLLSRETRKTQSVNEITIRNTQIFLPNPVERDNALDDNIWKS